MKILIAPYAKKLRNNGRNAKDYPWFKDVIRLLHDHELAQLGVDGEKWMVSRGFFSQPLSRIKELLREWDTWISVDSFLPHLAHHVGKRGVVIWGVSDPLIFGYPENINLLKDRKYLRKNQFDHWEAQPYSEEPFVDPEVVINAVNELAKK